MHVILVEQGFADSVWCKQLLQGLTSELKKRREAYCFRLDTLPEGAVFLIGSVFSWLSKTVGECNRLGIVPILLCTGPQRIPGCRYHCVCSDIAGSMQLLTASLGRTHGSRLALYGINPDSLGDRARKEAFLLEHPHPEAVYENSTSLAQCYERFAPCAEQYDAVICANGFAAVSLVKRLEKDAPGVLERLRVISCVQTLLTRYCRDRIASVDMNFACFGKTALALADLAKKQPHIRELTAAVKWSVEDMTLQASVPAGVSPEPERDAFYRDGELQRMLKLENLLTVCDDTDMTILTLLLQNKSYGDIAQQCYLTEGAVKYRIKNMRTLCDVPGRDDLTQLLRQYITLE